MTFDCVVDIDPKLKKEINPRIEWFRDGQKLDQVLTVQLDNNETLDTYRYLLYPNATLLIKKPSEEDLGKKRILQFFFPFDTSLPYFFPDLEKKF